MFSECFFVFHASSLTSFARLSNLCRKCLCFKEDKLQNLVAESLRAPCGHLRGLSPKSLSEHCKPGFKQIGFLVPPAPQSLGFRP
jgi:hypothetical protein